MAGKYNSPKKSSKGTKKSGVVRSTVYGGNKRKGY